MSKSILIYNQSKYKKLYPLKHLLHYCGSILDVYFAKVYNPPFYKLVIYIDPQNDNTFHMNENEFIQKAWNMTLINGHLIIPFEYTNCLESHNYKTITIQNKKYAFYTKKEDKLYIFYDKYRVVDFMIIGVEKAGTTSAMNNLKNHPEIYIAKNKQHPGDEMHFYDYHWNKGIDWYKNKFDYSYPCVGEKNPNIIYLDYVYPYIQSINPCVKMILFLRNPIDRAYSAWHMFHIRNQTYMKNENRKSFQESVNDEIDNRLNEPLNFFVANSHILQRGLYYKQLQKIKKYFPMQNICVVLLDDLEKDPKKEYEKMYDFLGVKHVHSNYKINLKGKYTNKEKNKTITPKLRKRMIDFFKSDVEKLEKLLKIKTDWLV